MNLKIVSSLLVLGFATQTFAQQNIGRNSKGCGSVTVSGNSSQVTTINGQTYTNNSSDDASASEASVEEVRAELAVKIERYMAAYQARSAKYQQKLAAYEASAVKSCKAKRCLDRMAQKLQRMEATIEDLTEQYDSLGSK